MKHVIKSITRTSKKIIIPLYSALSHLWNAVPSFGCPHAREVSANWNESNGRATKMVGS